MGFFNLKLVGRIFRNRHVIERFCLLTLFILILTSSVNAFDSTTLVNGNITLKILDIKEEDIANNIIKIAYGDNLKIKVTYPADANSIQYLDLKDRDNYNALIERYSLGSSGVQTVTIPSSEYSPATNFTLVINTSKCGDSLNSTAQGWTVQAEIVEPVVSMILNNPSNLIAKGDDIKITGIITATEYVWTLNGPYNKSRFSVIADNTSMSGFQSTYQEEAIVNSPNHKIELRIPSHVILNYCDGSNGLYSVEVWHKEYPESKSIVYFSIVDLNFSVFTDKDVVRLGEELEVFGNTNIADSSSEFDNTTIGTNCISIKMYEGTELADNTLVRDFYIDINNGSYKKVISFELGWEKI